MSRLGWIAGCSLLAALALAACSTGDTVSLDPVANAATETAKVSSVRIDMTITTRSPDLPQGVTTTASGIMDNRAKRGRMMIDFEKYPDLVAPSKRAAMSKTVPADVWIGDDQIVRRMKFNYEMRVLDANTGERRPTEMDMTMELYDFGAAVEIQLPPAGQVLDLMKLIEQAQ